MSSYRIKGSTYQKSDTTNCAVGTTSVTYSLSGRTANTSLAMIEAWFTGFCPNTGRSSSGWIKYISPLGTGVAFTTSSPQTFRTTLVRPNLPGTAVPPTATGVVFADPAANVQLADFKYEPGPTQIIMRFNNVFITNQPFLWTLDLRLTAY